MIGNATLRGLPRIRRPAPGAASRATGPVFVGGCLLAAAAGPIVSRSIAIGLAIGVVLALVSILALSARRPLGEVLIVTLLLVSALIDLPQRISLGITTGQGIETVGLVPLMGLAIANGYGATGIRAMRIAIPLAGFVLWTLAAFSWGGVNKAGEQNVLVYLGFVLMIPIAATLGRHRPVATYRTMERGFLVAAVISLGLYSAGVVLAGVHGHGSNTVVSARPFGLWGVILVAWFMAGRSVGIRWSTWLVVAVVLLTTLSLSRSALGTQFALIVLSRFEPKNFRGWFRSAGIAVAVVAVAVAAVFLIPPLHHRFFHGQTTNIGGVSLNTTGRIVLWSANWDAFLKSPVIGHGPGHSDMLTAALLGHNAGHPHNDYLRLLVDYGVIGLAIWVIAYLALLVFTWRAWQATRGSRTSSERVHQAAFLALVGIALCMSVDNPLIEIIKMAPLGALVGLSIGMWKPRRAAAAGGAERPVAVAVGSR
ncbi:MAG TPA: O-antigen ligase family protein [Gaiellales bacterium]|nr:O-antigen ligase family protein [Gaiellales bacterium]